MSLVLSNILGEVGGIAKQAIIGFGQRKLRAKLVKSVRSNIGILEHVIVGEIIVDYEHRGCGTSVDVRAALLNRLFF